LFSTIPLIGGKHALVDAADFERVSKHKWRLNQFAGRTDYAMTWIRVRYVMLHRFILDPPPGLEVDHVNRDGLDCRRGNMRLATRSQNSGNSPSRRGSTSRYKGVSWHRRDRRWVAEIMFAGRQYHLGRFSLEEEEDAALAYDAAARVLFGEFAWLNFADRELSAEVQAAMPPAAQALLNRKEVLP
jgi:hypothetical protein